MPKLLDERIAVIEEKCDQNIVYHHKVDRLEKHIVETSVSIRQVVGRLARGDKRMDRQEEIQRADALVQVEILQGLQSLKQTVEGKDMPGVTDVLKKVVETVDALGKSFAVASKDIKKIPEMYKSHQRTKGFIAALTFVLGVVGTAAKWGSITSFLAKVVV